MPNKLKDASSKEYPLKERSLEELLLASIDNAIKSDNRPYIYMFMNCMNKIHEPKDIAYKVAQEINEILCKELSDYLKKEKTRMSRCLFLNSFAAYSVLAAYSEPVLKDYKYYSMSLFLLLCFGVIGLYFKITNLTKEIKNISKKEKERHEKLTCDEKALITIIEDSRKQIIKKLYDAEQKLKIGIELKV